MKINKKNKINKINILERDRERDRYKANKCTYRHT